MSAPLPSHKGLSITPVLGPLSSHAVHRLSPGATSETWSHHKYSGHNACDPRPDASSPHGQGGSSDTIPYGWGRGACHRGHVITKEGRPEAQTDRGVAIQPHPGPPPCQTPAPAHVHILQLRPRPPLPPVPRPGRAKEEAAGSVAEVHPCHVALWWPSQGQPPLGAPHPHS